MGDLESYGFKINPYEPCVANKIVFRKQLTVCGHVDDLKISCVDSNEVKNMIQWLGEMHGSRGKRHNYLVMWIDYSIPGEVCIFMEKYLMRFLDNLPQEITETPATVNLFNVRDKNE